MNTRSLPSKVAGLFLIVFALHYVFDEPTRTPLMRAVFTPRDHIPISRHTAPAAGASQQLAQSVSNHTALPGFRVSLANDSFERWQGQQYPILEAWSSRLTVAPWDVVKKESEVVQKGRTAVRLECDEFSHCGNLQQELAPEVVAQLRGHSLSVTMWVLSATPEAPCLRIDDGVEGSSTCLAPRRGMWEPLSVEHRISPDATRVFVIVDVPAPSNSIYVDNASVVAYE